MKKILIIFVIIFLTADCTYSEQLFLGYYQYPYLTKNKLSNKNNIKNFEFTKKEFAPCVISFDKNNFFIMVKDNKVAYFEKTDLLNKTKPKKIIENSLKYLDINNDNKISRDELYQNNIRFVKFQNTESLLNDTKSDFDLSQIDYLYIDTLEDLGYQCKIMVLLNNPTKKIQPSEIWLYKFVSISKTSHTENIKTTKDPYILRINSKQYIMVKENNDNILDQNDILGITDTQATIFASLKPLDIDNDGYLTGKELNLSGVRLIQIDNNGKLINDKKDDFDNNKIIFIYIKELRKSFSNNGEIGSFGLFDVIITDENNNKKLVTGIVTFETNNNIQNYF